MKIGNSITPSLYAWISSNIFLITNQCNNFLFIRFLVTLSLNRVCLQNTKCSYNRQVHPDYGHNHFDQDDLVLPNNLIDNDHILLLRNLGNVCPKIQYLTIPKFHSNHLDLLRESLKNLPFLAHLYIGEAKVRIKVIFVLNVRYQL